MNHAELLDRINRRQAHVCVVGLGYVGVPVIRAIREAGYWVQGYDINHDVALRVQSELEIPCDFDACPDADVYIVCVPTPVKGTTPDLSHLQSVASSIKPGRFVVVESTVGPGDTERTFDAVAAFLAFSPEREDPGTGKDITRIPKIIASNTYEGKVLISALYSRVFKSALHMTPDIKTAEMAKLMENTFRAVNIALACEFRDAAEAFGVDPREATRAAATKGFGYMPFNAGVGVGGHCIPVDPWYLIHNVREVWKSSPGIARKRLSIIRAALDRNAETPYEIAYRLLCSPHVEDKKTKMLVLGATYKKNIDDMRNSPAVELFTRLADHGIDITWFDEHVSNAFRVKNTARLLELKRESVFNYDVVTLAVDHDDFDYALLHGHPCVYDLTGRLPPNTPNVHRL